MNIRQARKIVSKLRVTHYPPGKMRTACRVCRRRKHRLARGAGIEPGDVVYVLAETGYDSEGVPVSLRYGVRGRVVELDGFPQVLCYTDIGLGVIGVPVEHLLAI